MNILSLQRNLSKDYRVTVSIKSNFYSSLGITRPQNCWGRYSRFRNIEDYFLQWHHNRKFLEHLIISGVTIFINKRDGRLPQPLTDKQQQREVLELFDYY